MRQTVSFDILQTILVVEDNPLNGELISGVLRKCGYRVFWVTDGDAAHLEARQHRPDLILMDIGLPGKSGLEVAQQFKVDEGLRTIPLVACTAFAMKGDREKLLVGGFEDVVVKPIDPSALVQTVDRVLARQ